MMPALVVALLSAVTPATPATTALPVSPVLPVLQNGDRVVFLGDSITVAHTYGRWIEEYCKLRHPTWSLTFINAGIGGHTAFDGYNRIETDVVAQKPTVVFVNFGMNDSSYPPGTDGAAFEKYMGLILDRLHDVGVRSVVWLDPSPYDVDGIGPGGWNGKRDEKLEKLAQYAHDEGARRHLVVVPWHQTVNDALASWKAAKRNKDKDTRLMPDRIHPNPLAHAVMAATALRAMGEDVSSSALTGKLAGGKLKVDGVGAFDWDAKLPLVMDVSAVKAPLPMVVDAKDALDLGNPDVIALRRLLLRLEGLPGDAHYRVKLGEVDAGRFSSSELARGVDLLASAVPRLEPPKDLRPTLGECTSTTGDPFLNDTWCLFDMLFEKDQLRIAMRNEKVRALPDFVPDRLEKYLTFQGDWIAAVEQEIENRAKATRTAPHTMTISVE